MELITGSIDIYLFYDEASGYCVIRLENGNTVVGNLPRLDSRENVEFTGEWVTHPKFGRQFKIETFKILYPTSKEGIIKFFSSRIIKGIGEKTGRKIVEKFGERTFEIFDNNIERLGEISGFGKKKINSIKKSWEEQKGIKDIMIFLQSFGLSTTYAMKIYRMYGDKTKDIIKANPYRLAYDIRGISFKLADRMARSAGFNETHPYRIKAGIIHVLTEASRTGHVYLPENVLIEHCRNLLDFELVKSDPHVKELFDENKVFVEDEKVYLSLHYNAEKGIETRVNDLLSFSGTSPASLNKLLKLTGKNFSRSKLMQLKVQLNTKY